MPQNVELQSIERMYADDLFDAVESGQPFMITVDGRPAAVVIPAGMVQAIWAMVRITLDSWSPVLRKLASLLDSTS